MTTKKKSTDCRQYRIGDFARYMGVTSEFLKHYQESGLIDVNQRASGYRYYRFDQSARILQYMRLRNYGMSLKEMSGFLTGTVDEAVDFLDQKTDEMRKQITRMQAVVEEHKRLRVWYEERCLKSVDWEICNVEPCCFLYHTSSRDFLESESIYDIIKDWSAWLPVTKSAMCVSPSLEPDVPHLHWGFAVRESLLKRYGLPVNEAVRRMVFGKAFVYHFSGLPNGFLMADIASGRHPAFLKMKELGFEQAGDALIVHEMQLTDESDGQICVGRCIIPVKD
ncbi:MerR family transcriptional regulator [Sutterella sp.]|uniref:MerR family transcriptional regulator n=1 Tax=Sutterella sp. TaxID=1981025 RepID=UPI003FD865AF